MKISYFYVHHFKMIKSMKSPKFLVNLNIILKSYSPKVLPSYSPAVLPSYLLTVFLAIFLSSSLFAQHEADNWIFDGGAGLNFTTGDPIPLLINAPSEFHSGTVMSDTLGNIIFYFNGDRVYNRNDQVMLNGDGMLPDHSGDCQGSIAFPKPNSDIQYYIFNVSNENYPDGLYYSLVDMTLDGGLGGVTPVKNVKLTAANTAVDKLFPLKNAKGDGYWVITRLFNDDRYACFKVDPSGVDPEPVYSSTGIYRGFLESRGPVKVSPDKKYLVSCYWTHSLGPLNNFEVCSFNPETGKIEFKYYIARQWTGPNSFSAPSDCEFSPDSKYLYVAYTNIDTWSGGALYQYNMQLAGDSAAFHDSGIRIHDNCPHSFQLSNDGRIYSGCLVDTCDLPWNLYVSVINKPWELGVACDFDSLTIYCGGKLHAWECPNILLDYLYRFEWSGDRCQFSPVNFIPHFIPTPDSVRWFFDEFAPGNYSTELSPTYSFQFPGIHEVEVDIWYPTGRFEHTSREIEIYPTPQPDLGPDTLICRDASLTLSAGCTADLYSWSTGQIGPSQITVSDSGDFWVKAWFTETGCAGYDTIHIGFHPAVEIDTAAVTVTPTSCGGSTGSITGLYALGPAPFAYKWKDLSGVEYGTDIDVYGLPAGQYYLTITDANGCETQSPVYTVEDAGNLQVLSVQLTHPHCGRPDGQIEINGFSPSGTVLQYSIDNGGSYSSDSVFSGLTAGSYLVHIRDANGCEGFYEDNPVLLADIPGPQVIQTVVTDETDGQGNGSIQITASGSTPALYYSIDTLSGWQPDDGLFGNLSAGFYTCVVRDENGCDTVFTVEVQNIILTWLQAITGPGDHCLGSSVTVPVEVDNFSSVAVFQLRISYNKDNLLCEGYANAHPLLAANLTGWVDIAAGEITLQWIGTDPVTFTGQQNVADLVFITLQAGQGMLDWYTGAAGSYFTNPQGNPIPAEFHTGQVNIYEPPRIISPSWDSKIVCPGDFVSFMGIASGNQDPINYLWTWPDGSTTENDPAFWSITPEDAGEYTLLATDIMGCTDQKTVQLEVSLIPVAAFHGTDTLEVGSGYILDAGAGLAHYLWNTGDTTESIKIKAEGMYSVGMESLSGCVGMDSIYLKIKAEEIPSNFFYIPNAFTPDGDGNNDIFKPVPINPELSIVNCQLSIFDRWGGKVFSSDDFPIGWDGKKNGEPCPGGVYVYKIVFAVDGVAGNQEQVGTVILVR